MCCSPCPNSWKRVSTSRKLMQRGRSRPPAEPDYRRDRQPAAEWSSSRDRHQAAPPEALVHPRTASLVRGAAVRIQIEGWQCARPSGTATRAKKRTSSCQTGDVPVGARRSRRRTVGRARAKRPCKHLRAAESRAADLPRCRRNGASRSRWAQNATSQRARSSASGRPGFALRRPGAPSRSALRGDETKTTRSDFEQTTAPRRHPGPSWRRG